MPFPPGQSGNPLTQFQPGQSGNAAGYPEGVPNRGTLLRRFLAAGIDYKDPSTGEFVRGTIEEAITLAILAKASEGDVNAYKEVMDSVYGKLTDKNELILPAKTVIKIGGKRPAKPDAAPAADS